MLTINERNAVHVCVLITLALMSTLINNPRVNLRFETTL